MKNTQAPLAKRTPEPGSRPCSHPSGFPGRSLGLWPIHYIRVGHLQPWRDWKIHGWDASGHGWAFSMQMVLSWKGVISHMAGWKIPELNGGLRVLARKVTSKCSIFHCHVWLPEGKPQLVGGFNPLKNISQLGWLFPIHGKNKSCSKPPTSQPCLENSDFDDFRITPFRFLRDLAMGQCARFPSKHPEIPGKIPS